MPITHRVIPEHRLIVSAHIGTVPDSECISSYRDLYQTDGAELSFNHLVDLSQTDSTERSPDTLRNLARINETMYGDSKASAKIAIIAPSQLSFGLGRMYEAHASGTPGQISVLRSAGEAISWLGISEEVFHDS